MEAGLENLGVQNAQQNPTERRFRPIIQFIIMKKPSTSLVIGFCGIAIGAMLSSCVATYDDGMQGPVSQYQSGYQLRTLPSGYRTETISGERYYSHNNTYYRPSSGGYVVVNSPRRYDSRYDSRYQGRDAGYDSRDTRYDDRDPRYDGRRSQSETIITRLPSGYRTRTYNGTRYYEVNDQYYQQQGSGYTIVQRPY